MHQLLGSTFLPSADRGDCIPFRKATFGQTVFFSFTATHQWNSLSQLVRVLILSLIHMQCEQNVCQRISFANIK